MLVRSVTCFVTLEDPDFDAAPVRSAGALARDAATALQEAGFGVQTVRLATQPLAGTAVGRPGLGRDVARAARDAGFGYVSLGPMDISAAERVGAIDALPRLLAEDESLFTGVLVREPGPVLLRALPAMGRVIHEIAHGTPQGFGNLRAAMLFGVGPLGPFFPAAYHDGGGPAVALALESADLAVEAFSAAGTPDEVCDRLVRRVEEDAARLVAAVRPVAARAGVRFAGLDFSWAPFPEEARSVGTAVERLGIDGFGAPGTLYAASLLTEALRRARFPHTGFNGLMLPVLEDSVLARRSQDGLYTINDLLLDSAVCGTGLDTVPLPGDTPPGELAAILLDVATLAFRLGKPLTARLMPIPGAHAGDVTTFDFPFFANGRVLATKGRACPGLWERIGP